MSSFSLHVVSTDDDEKNDVQCLSKNFCRPFGERGHRKRVSMDRKGETTEDKDEECFVRKKDGGPVGGIPREKKRWIKQGQKRPQKRP